jgi:WD40 repeat protein
MPGSSAGASALRSATPYLCAGLAVAGLTTALLVGRSAWTVIHCSASTSIPLWPSHGPLLLTLHAEGDCRVLDCRAGTVRTRFKTRGWTIDAAFSHDGSRVITGGDGGLAEVWDASNGSLLTELHTEHPRVYRVSFGPDATTAITLSGSGPRGERPGRADVRGRLSVWDVRTGQRLSSPWIPTKSRLLGFAPDRSCAATAASSELGVIRLWNAGTWEQVAVCRAVDKGTVAKTGFTSDGRRIVGGVGGKTHVWDVHEQRVLYVVKGHLLALSLAGRVPLLATNPMDGRTARLHEVDTGREVMPLVHGDYPACAAFSPDGARVATGGGSRVNIWDTTSGERLGSLHAPVNVVWIGLFEDTCRLATLSVEETSPSRPAMVLRLWAKN